MDEKLGVCGCRCKECRLYPQECLGCHEIKGKACWLFQVGLEVCDFYQCAVMERGYINCGECPEIPCDKFFRNKNPKWTVEEHQKIIKNRVQLLKGVKREEIK